MERQIRWREVLFFITCLLLGVLGELSFFHEQIGMSFLIFISGFYAVLLIRFGLGFSNRRIGILIMASIWILAGTYAFYDQHIFYELNVLLIPVLTFFHVVLITRPTHVKWSKLNFVFLLLQKIKEGIMYAAAFINQMTSQVFKRLNTRAAGVAKQVTIGLLLGLPILFAMTLLLMSADRVFADVMLKLPSILFDARALQNVVHGVIALLMGLLFFGVFQVLKRSDEQNGTEGRELLKSRVRWNAVTPLTILFLLNSVYVIFTVIQFKYFFGEGLQDGFTYAEYARRGFFELLFVTLINWSLLITFLKMVNMKGRWMKRVLRLMYALLVAVSAVMLLSSYQRLGLYEAAYGYTVERVMAHACMLLLMVIFAYTFIRIWIERLALLHFYLIVGLVFYTGINAAGIEKIVVENNLERYEANGKIDIDYFKNLSWTGLAGLMDLYELDPEYPGLEEYLEKQKQHLKGKEDDSWQSFNMTRDRVKERMEGMEF
ncbi:hypothetical protein JNUCC1_00493 [Lentibacillus sp. JNUCC-1]|nr:hypothetical protein [Lentibacillus sp. JNUCC-1]